jgi:hypothetical protein
LYSFVTSDHHYILKSQYDDIRVPVQLGLNIFRGPVCLFFVTLINGIAWFEFKKHMNKKIHMKSKFLIEDLRVFFFIYKKSICNCINLNLTNKGEATTAHVITRDNQNMSETRKRSNEQRASRNITLMVLSMVIIFSIGYTPYTIQYIISLFVKSSTTWFRIIFLSAYTTLVISHSLYIIIYYKFNTIYKKELLALIRCYRE